MDAAVVDRERPGRSRSGGSYLHLPAVRPLHPPRLATSSSSSSFSTLIANNDNGVSLRPFLQLHIPQVYEKALRQPHPASRLGVYLHYTYNASNTSLSVATLKPPHPPIILSDGQRGPVPMFSGVILRSSCLRKTHLVIPRPSPLSHCHHQRSYQARPCSRPASSSPCSMWRGLTGLGRGQALPDLDASVTISLAHKQGGRSSMVVVGIVLLVRSGPSTLETSSVARVGEVGRTRDDEMGFLERGLALSDLARLEQLEPVDSDQPLPWPSTRRGRSGRKEKEIKK